ncbi:MAG TPA: 30S ribosomal protein S2 [Caldisericia bacterium]|nr:30S ribosomal protein S2 [Caldisericia bacterium]HPF49577.1 30S ribosomal protein S2 [Caldisericia bacterium]HPI84507.1 30S ribosomal protein S2 [Caldisericia bacterium]HPQ93873.1 30S ribosomal protein S2 [Caldisericia bacterium]HRV75418.1 30S ribosomal protein S2 [Caldisericia bacterium]
MGVVNMKHLLEAGVHFGHQTKRWNPKMRKFIFTARNGIHIIDLRITAEQCELAYARVKEITQNGGNIIFIGTKKQAQDIVEEEAKRCGAHYVNQRWFGGTLTNFITIHQRIQKLRELEEKEVTGELQRMTGREFAKAKKLKDKMKKFLSGIKNMDVLPEAIFVTDTHKDRAAIVEATKLGITVIAIVDTNSDPDLVDIPIPGNDDAIRSIKFFTKLISDGVVEGREGVDFERKDEDEESEERAAKRADADDNEEKVIDLDKINLDEFEPEEKKDNDDDVDDIVDEEDM